MAKRLFVAVILVGVAAVFYFAHRRSSNSAVQTAALHSPAPDFSLPTLDGSSLDLSSYKGKVVVLDFWATWCEPCKEEIPHFIELQNKYGSQGLQVIGVSMDDEPGPVRDFYQRFKMNYPVVMGTAKTGDLYGGVLGLPITFLIGRDGQLYSKHPGATSAAVFEREVQLLLKSGDTGKQAGS